MKKKVRRVMRWLKLAKTEATRISSESQPVEESSTAGEDVFTKVGALKLQETHQLVVAKEVLNDIVRTTVALERAGPIQLKAAAIRSADHEGRPSVRKRSPPSTSTAVLSIISDVTPT